MYFKNNNCRICEKVCQPQAIDYTQEDKVVEEEVGAIVVATGYELYPTEKIKEYGGGRYKDVINGLQFERLLSSSGPTQGEIKRPSDGKVPKRVVFVSCVGSRDPEHHLPYCSKICCMYSAKHAMLYKHRVPEGEAIVFYIDTRAGGKDYEEFLVRTREEGKVLYIRGKVSRIFKKGDEFIVWSVNTLTGEQIQVKCDMVVLSMAIIPSSGTVELARKLKIQTNQYGFLNEAHPKLRPLESLSLGFYLAGCAQAQKDIPDTVAQASGAASKVLEMFSQKELLHEPTVAIVDENICRGCGLCVSVCPYEAKELVSKDKKKVVKINEILCEGCGSCVSVCPSKAMQQRNFRNLQILRMIEVMS
jgi:heterodisulfide reductase subunit A